MLSVKPTMNHMFIARGPISLEHMSSRWQSLDAHLTTYHPTIKLRCPNYCGVPFRHGYITGLHLIQSIYRHNWVLEPATRMP
jgi:hypothetical protein